MTTNNKFRWVCDWNNGKSYYNPDYEGCSCRGRFVDDIDTAIKRGLEHNKTHSWSGWGYAPLGWENRSTHIEVKTPSGKIKCLDQCHKL